MVVSRTSKVLCFCVMVIKFIATYTAAAEFAAGTGMPNDPYQIAMAEQLISIGSDPNLLDKHFILVNDIDLDPNLPGGRVFNKAVIAPDSDRENKLPQSVFTGSFDGKGHKINNLTIRGKADYLGLFGGIWKGHVLNLGMENVSIFVMNASSYHGCIAGLNNGRIANCYAKGTVTASKSCQLIGGLVGQNHLEGIIINCRAAVNLSPGDKCQSLGGLVGTNSGTISNCYASAHVLVEHETIGLGGLVGFCARRITNCYTTGSISVGDGSLAIGGLAGFSGGSIKNCYAACRVFAGQNATDLGGLVGQNWGYTGNCYFLSPSDGGGPDNGVGSSLTDEQMKRQANYVDWDFKEVWTICDGKDYPSLRPEAPEPPKPSPPDLSRCTRLEIRYYPSNLEHVCHTVKDRSLLSPEEIEYLQSPDAIVVDDQKLIKALAHDISSGSYGGSGGAIGARPIADIRYHNGERLTSFTYFILSIKSEEGHWFDYDRRLPSLEKLTPQIRPFRLRLDCADNLRSLHDRLQSYLESEKAYPAATKWNDSIVRFLYEPPWPVTVRVLNCPSAGKGKSHYAMNPNCEPNSLPDTVLLFETKAGWNQHGGSELFTFDNHDPRGGCVILNDGTVKFIRTKEELQQLRWK